MPRELVAIIVNYGTADLAIAAVESLRAQDEGVRPAEVHVVDNASPEGDAERLAQAHAERGWGPAVTIRAESANHGFGRGNNLVLEDLARRDSPPDFVFLLNPDARLLPGALAHLLSALDAAPEAGAAGGRELLPDDTPSAAAFRFPNAIGEVVATLALGPVSRVARRWTLPLPADQPEGPVDWVSGSALLLRWTALSEAGFFDPGFFLYYEEVDLLRRLKASGWQTLYVPSARIIHDVGAATDLGRTDLPPRRRPDYLYRSWRHYFVRSHGRAGALGIALLSTGAATIERAYSALTGRRGATPPGFFADQWTYVLKPLITGRAPPEARR